MAISRRRLLQTAVTLTLASSMLPATAITRPPLQVVASFSILADITRAIGGEAVDVKSLVPPGADAHVFSPSPADAQAVAKADLLIINGLRHEGWISRLIKAVGYKRPVVVATDGIKPRQTKGGADPHAWQSLANVLVYVDNIRAALVAARPEQAAAINARAAGYRRQVVELERETIERLARFPAAQRRVVTGHDAFGYFADAYGVEFIAPRGWSTDSEPSAEAVARIVRQLREQRARVLLAESRSDPRLLDRIAKEAGVTIGGSLHADTLSPPGGEADTFLRLFRHNVDTLVDALSRAGS
ncbi:metal ABC transporter solute-binding protein, Zn/Mn family [Piscinibacter sakaiensis]|uniref:metal ABC transporter solute-binding protein, Zn/Mn family n=1 Tax=Piscinibacter sakaiensis TaxID=1547922 RepID=UPI003AB00BDE